MLDVLAQFQPIIGSHVYEIDSVPDLRILGRNDSHTPNHIIFQRESEAELCPYLHREHRFDVAATQTDLIG